MKIFFYLFILVFIKKKIIKCDECFEYSCQKCIDGIYGHCLECREGFKLVDGTCPCADVSCALCTTGLAGLHICHLCKNEYYSYNKDCYCDIEDCEICSEDGCLLCRSGYFFNTTSKECEEQDDKDKIKCYDPYCESCFSEEQGACDYCQDGYDNIKGICIKLPEPQNDECEEGYYLSDDHICEKICSGVKCNLFNYRYYLCPQNHCLVCSNNVLQIFSECDNSDICTQEGCLNCITDDECVISYPGYYILGGNTTKCPAGCSICGNSDTCLYCLSGYELNYEKKCVFKDNFDFNVNQYKNIKNKLIELNYPEEIEGQVNQCHKKCSKCYDNLGICKECETLYYLQDNQCISNCTDNNCIDCEMENGIEKCTNCTTGYYIKDKKCYKNCTDIHCLSCFMKENVEICEKCSNEYNLDKSQTKCNARVNYVYIIFCIVGCLIMLISIISLCIYRKKRFDFRNEIMRLRQEANSVSLYNRSAIERSARQEINKEEIADEFEIQKRKMEKKSQMCQYCKKKIGKFKGDCGCILCKEHSTFNNVEGKNVCHSCKKKIKKVTQIKYPCHICLQKKLSVAHFKCGCALEVCKDCYIKCKSSSNKCPGCRAII